MPGLKFLDSTPVSDKERQEAQRVGKFLKPVKIGNETVSKNLQQTTGLALPKIMYHISFIIRDVLVYSNV